MSETPESPFTISGEPVPVDIFTPEYDPNRVWVDVEPPRPETD